MRYGSEKNIFLEWEVLFHKNLYVVSQQCGSDSIELATLCEEDTSNVTFIPEKKLDIKTTQ